MGPYKGILGYISGGTALLTKLTWKWREAHYKTTILYIGPSMSFHVNLGKVMVP